MCLNFELMCREIENGSVILKQWEKNNEEKVNEYFTVHDWLRADIQKVRRFQKENDLVIMAVTRRMIFGRTRDGMVHAVERATLGIQNNFR